jgi:hypothetical protein
MRHHPRKTTGKGRAIPLRILGAPGWLRHYLERHGQTKLDTVEKHAVLQGFTVAELHRAAATLAVEEVPGGPGETCKYWRIK